MIKKLWAWYHRRELARTIRDQAVSATKYGLGYGMTAEYISLEHTIKWHSNELIRLGQIPQKP